MNGRIPRAGVSPPAPGTALEFAEYFKRSEFGRANREDMDAYRAEFTDKPDRAHAYKQSARSERAKRARQASPYTISIPMQVRAVMTRRVQIIKGNMAEQIILLG